MKTVVLASLLAVSAAHADVALDTTKFTQSLDAMTSNMTQAEQQLFFDSVVHYGMAKSHQHDVSLSVDQLAAKSLNEFDGLTAQEILHAIELSNAVDVQQQVVEAKFAQK